MRRIGVVAGGLFASGWLFAAPLLAADIQVQPVLLFLTPDAPIAAMTLRNVGGDPLLMQVQIVDWSQQGGKDVYKPTRDILANPPQFQLAPKGEQIVRFGLRVDRQSVERSYRAYVDEVPSRAQTDAGKVVTVLRISVPIFVPPASGAPAHRWTIKSVGKDARLVLSNPGTIHTQILHLTLKGPAGDIIANQAVATYVLAGQSREWSLPVSGRLAAGDHVSLTAQTDRDTITDTLIVQPLSDGKAAP